MATINLGLVGDTHQSDDPDGGGLFHDTVEEGVGNAMAVFDAVTGGATTGVDYIAQMGDFLEAFTDLSGGSRTMATLKAVFEDDTTYTNLPTSTVPRRYLMGNHDIGGSPVADHATWLSSIGQPAAFGYDDIGNIRVIFLDTNKDVNEDIVSSQKTYIGPTQMGWLAARVAEADTLGMFTVILMHNFVEPTSLSSGFQCLVDDSSFISTINNTGVILVCSGHRHGLTGSSGFRRDGVTASNGERIYFKNIRPIVDVDVLTTETAYAMVRINDVTGRFNIDGEGTNEFGMREYQFSGNFGANPDRWDRYQNWDIFNPITSAYSAATATDDTNNIGFPHAGAVVLMDTVHTYENTGGTGTYMAEVTIGPNALGLDTVVGLDHESIETMYIQGGYTSGMKIHSRNGYDRVVVTNPSSDTGTGVIIVEGSHSSGFSDKEIKTVTVDINSNQTVQIVDAGNGVSVGSIALVQGVVDVVDLNHSTDVALVVLTQTNGKFQFSGSINQTITTAVITGGILDLSVTTGTPVIDDLTLKNATAVGLIDATINTMTVGGTFVSIDSQLMGVEVLPAIEGYRTRY